MLLISNVHIVNEGQTQKGHILIENERIKAVIKGNLQRSKYKNATSNIIDAKGRYIFPGAIDDQVHFREPGLTHKAEIYTESKAAVAGGITSFMEMPNTVPQALTQELLEDKYQIASQKSLANYSFFMGASNDNLEQVLKTNPREVCGVKVFMGSSTGNMLVDNKNTLDALFSSCELPIATHCEDEGTIQANIKEFKKQYGENVPIEHHPKIRSEEACYRSSSMAVELATKHNARLHVLHISTEKELTLFGNSKPLHEKRITSEACIHHLWFSDKDYADKGTSIKWNPAVKSENDRAAIRAAVIDNRIDVIATDHAPHTLEEKNNTYFNAPSGGPLVQHALVAMLDLYHQGVISLEKIVEKMCHAPAQLFNIEKRGYIREGYYADLVLVDLNCPWKVEPNNILAKCKWSPFEGHEFRSKVIHTYVNGELAYDDGLFDESSKGMRLKFER